jgi:hypothetical protein
LIVRVLKDSEYCQPALLLAVSVGKAVRDFQGFRPPHPG